MRCQLIFNRADVLEKTLQYSVDVRELSNEILSKRTILSVYKVLSSEMVLKVNEPLEGMKLEESKKVIENVRDFMEKGLENLIQEKYDVWYDVWNNSYLPMMMNFPKWFDTSENLVPGDIIYFKLLESKMSATWRLGKVEKVKLGADGFVREVIVSYKDTSSENPDDWIHRAVRRPVRNVVKLFNIEETSFMEEIANAQKLAQEILEKKKISSYPSDDSDDEVINPTINKEINSEKIDIPVLSSDEEVAHIVPKPRKQRKKRSTELERLEIDMKGWNYLEENVNVEPFMNNVFMSYDVIPEDKDFSDIGSKLEIDNDEDFIENVYNDFDNHMYLL